MNPKTLRILTSLTIAMAAVDASSQIVIEDSTRATISPYVGIGWWRFSSSELDDRLRAFGSPSFSNRDQFMNLTVGMTSSLPWQPVSIGVEYAMNQASIREDGRHIRYQLHSFGPRAGYSASLGHNWYWSVSAGLEIQSHTLRLSSNFDFGSRAFDSLMVQPLTSARELSGEDFKLMPAASVGYAVPVGNNDGRETLVVMALRAGTEIRLGNVGWRINGETTLDGPEMPYRPVLIDLLMSLAVRDMGR